MQGAGYDCRKGVIYNKGLRYDKNKKYLPDGIWNNVSAHVEWINNLVAKKLTAEVRRDFQFTKRKCEGGSVGKADLLFDQLKVKIEFVCQAAGGSGDPGLDAAGRVVTRAPGRETGDV